MKPKLITFRLESAQLEKLLYRSAELGISPSAFAKRIVTGNLGRKTDDELMEQFEFLQTKVETVNESVLSYVKEVFTVLSDLPREELDEILNKAYSRFNT